MLPERKGHILENTQVGEQRPELEQHPHPATDGVQARRIKATHVLPIKQDFTARSPLLPPIRRSTVVLPPPEAPISAVTLPRGTVSETSRRMSRSP